MLWDPPLEPSEGEWSCDTQVSDLALQTETVKVLFSALVGGVLYGSQCPSPGPPLSEYPRQPVSPRASWTHQDATAQPTAGPQAMPRWLGAPCLGQEPGGLRALTATPGPVPLFALE